MIFLFEKNDYTIINSIFKRNTEIELSIKEATEKHLKRFYQKTCRAEAGPIFIDILLNLERVSFHCKTIAERISGLENPL